MTYCIGFKSKTAVFLVADSMISGGLNEEINEVLGAYTTFGEFVKQDDKTMQDQRYKVFKLSGDVLVTFAGDVDNAIEAIGIFERELKKGVTPIKAFDSVLSAGPFSSIELLVGFMDKQKPKLYSYNYMGNGLFKEEHSSVHLGTGKEHEFLTNKSSEIVDYLINEDFGDGKCLVFLLAFLQNFSMKNSLLMFDVGGFFFGGYVHNRGVQRMWNTTYLMYASIQGNGERKLHLNYEVSLIRKEDLLLVSSSFLDHERIYMQEINWEEEKPELSDLENRVNELRDDYWEGKIKFTVLLNQFNYGFTVCHMENGNKVPEVEILYDRNKGQVRYRLSSDLVNYLKYPPNLKEEDIDKKWDTNNPAHIEMPIRYFA